MNKDFVMNRLQVGCEVKTTEYYEDRLLYLFGNCSPIKKAKIIDILDEKIAKVKLANGEMRTINLMWLELT